MKKLLPIVVIVAALAAALWLVRPAYRASKEKKFAAQAEEALAKGEHRKALVNAQQVLVLNSNNVTACLVMAELAELSRSPNVMVWRRRVAEIDPSRSNRLVLAAAALRYEAPPFPTAAQTLGELASATNDAAFHLVSAQLALKQNRLSDGEKHIEEAIRLEPANDSHRINLNVIRLESRDRAVSAVAQAELAGRTNSAQALRALVVHFAGRRNFADAARYSASLVQVTNSLWSDKLEHLGVLRGAESPGFDPYLATLQTGAGTNAFAAAELVTRLTELGLAERALAWVKSLPASMQKESPLPMTVASALFSMARWRELEETLTAQNWDDREFARKALLTYAVRKQGAADVAAAHWRDASKLAGDRPELLGALAQMSAAWGWTNETTVLLWRAAKEFPKERWPLESLQSIYLRLGNTPGLLEVNALALVRNRAVVQVLDGFLCTIPADRFRDALPPLRRAFAALGPTERRYLLENLVAVRNIGARAPEVAATMRETDKEKLKAMSAELSTVLDDLDDLL